MADYAFKLKLNYMVRNEKPTSLWPFNQEIPIFWESGEDHRTCTRCNEFFVPFITNYLEEFQTAGTQVCTPVNRVGDFLDI